MIIEELAYKVSVRADEFMSGKKKVEDGAKDLGKNVSDAMDGAAENSKKVGTEVDKVGRQLKRTSEDTKRPFGLISGGFYGVAKGAKEFGEQGKDAFSGVQAGAAKFLGLALSIEGTRRLFSSSVNSLVDLGNAASNLDLPPKVVDGWKNGAESVGSSAEAITSALVKMKAAKNWSTSGIGAPDESTIATMQLGTQTGVDIMGAKNADEMFRRTEEALRKLPKEQAQIWTQRVGIDASLLPSILDRSLDKNQGQFQGRSNASADTIKQAREVKEIMSQLDQTTSNLGNSLVAAFGPDVIDMMNAFNKWVDGNGGKVIDFFKDTTGWVKQFTEALNGNKNAMHGWGQITDNFNLFTGFDKPVVDASSWMDSKLKGNSAWEWWKKNKDRPILGGAGGEVEQHAQSVNAGGFSMDRLLDSVAKAESNGNPNAVSKAGATGTYQFMAPTARDMGLRVDSEVDERRDPVKSREAARKYLNRLINRYDGNIDLALKAYNVGPGALDRWIKSGSRPQDLNSETSNYVGRVSKNYGADLSQVAALGQMPAGAQTTDNSQTSTTHIGNVNLNTNPQSVDAIMKSIQEQQRRSNMGGSFVSGNG